MENLYTYKVTLKSDQGLHSIRLVGGSIETATATVMKIFKCPRRAIVGIKVKAVL
jgi:hypothetical protein